MENKFEDLRIVMMPQRIKPGEKGNPIDKQEGQEWGATIQANHSGPGGSFDFGWFAYLAGDMNTCISNHVAVDLHTELTLVTVEVRGIWTHGTLGHGAIIGAEAIIAEGASLAPFHGFGVKRQPRDIPGAIIWTMVRDAYRIIVEEIWVPIVPPIGF